MHSLTGRSRFSWPESDSGGFNCSADFTFTDVWGGFSWIITTPGDWILNYPVVARFFELDTPVVGNMFSWWLGIMLLSLLALIVLAPLAYAYEDRQERKRRKR